MTPKNRRQIRKQGARAAKIDSERLEALLGRAVDVCKTLLGDMDPGTVKIESANDLYQITNGLTGLVRAQIELSKWDAERTGLLEAARDELLNEIRSVIAGRPQLLDELLEVFDSAVNTPRQLTE